MCREILYFSTSEDLEMQARLAVAKDPSKFFKKNLQGKQA